MKLYISDLDGTLLNSEQRISEYSKQIINSLIENGVNFTIATARSLEATKKIIDGLNLNLPIILNNGVFIYDVNKKRNVVEHFIDKFAYKALIEYIKLKGLSPFISTKLMDRYRVYYSGIHNYGEQDYVEGRVKNGDKRFTLSKDYSECGGENVVCISLIDEEDKLLPIYNYLKNEFDLQYHFARDIYSNFYWLEITNKYGNKRQAVKYLKRYIGADKLVCFGDNLNDSPMFEESDEKYAVKNANQALKKMATAVIGSNEEDAIANFIKADNAGDSPIK
ncbi:HAD family hydrolase [Clostridium oryzae]|uniref:Putative phosphatase n=1 Tax=Clostridium oryzae TaxID=1450648 RepID=A0A1V4IHP9_9CLOT|nr:HAD family hydrolase [Clostridium oryzae]OPJ59344.1 putative phosphatase [Clostridium oryzae]